MVILKIRALFCLLLAICTLPLIVRASEVSLAPVAISGTPAPGLGSSVVFNHFTCLSLADDGRLGFIANVTGSGVNTTNSQGIWAGLPGALNLIALAGATATGAGSGVTFNYFSGLNLDRCEYLGFIANLAGPNVNTNAPGSLWVATSNPQQVLDTPRLVAPLTNIVAVGVTPTFESGSCNCQLLIICGTNLLACGVSLSGPNIGSTNDTAILIGSDSKWVLSPQSGSPAPGIPGQTLNVNTQTKALSPDGQEVFTTDPDGSVWMGPPGAFQAVAVPGNPAPVALGGASATYLMLAGNEVEVNALGEIAFTATLAGPALNNTNSDFVVAGAPGTLRAVAQAGQPAPGIPGAFFGGQGLGATFGDVLIGSDGSVAFTASYTSTGSDWGLWIAPSGGTPILIARNGSQAPGAPAGVVFEAPFPYLPPFDEFYMNARGQIVFRGELAGPGIGQTNSDGIWLAEKDGTVSPIVLAGQTVDVGGAQPQIGRVTFGAVGVPTVGGPEDGRCSPFDDNGEVLFWANWQNPAGPPHFGGYSEGVFLARTGIVLSSTIIGNDVQITFPTLAGKQYRVDFTTNLTAVPWSVLSGSVLGTGSPVSVTDSGGMGSAQKFYRVVRLN